MSTFGSGWNAQQLLALLCSLMLAVPFVNAQQGRVVTSRPRTSPRGPVPLLGVEYWTTQADCERAVDYVFYYPRVAHHRALSAGEFVAGLPNDACVDMPLPEMNGQRGWVRQAAGTLYIYQRAVSGPAVPVASWECSNGPVTVAFLVQPPQLAPSVAPAPPAPPAPTIVQVQGRRGRRGEPGARGEPGPPGPQGVPGKDVGHWKLWTTLGIVGAAAGVGLYYALRDHHKYPDCVPVIPRPGFPPIPCPY